ncbi:MAG: hypothetical protein AAFP84_20100 [Actinomycetota bacterium]
MNDVTTIASTHAPTATASAGRAPHRETPPSHHRPTRAPFSETHRRVVRDGAELDDVWRAALDVTPREIRTFGPLIALRGLPSRLTGRGRGVADDTGDGPLLQLFESEGFVRLGEYSGDGVRRVEFGAAGRFWSLRDNHPIHFDGPDDFTAFDRPGHARIWFELVATDTGDGIELSTTTLVCGTDRRAELRFAPYWALIRLPSGLIRRSWLAAIERRARR